MESGVDWKREEVCVHSKGVDLVLIRATAVFVQC